MPWYLAIRSVVKMASSIEICPNTRVSLRCCWHDGVTWVLIRPDMRSSGAVIGGCSREAHLCMPKTFLIQSQSGDGVFVMWMEGSGPRVVQSMTVIWTS